MKLLYIALGMITALFLLSVRGRNQENKLKRQGLIPTTETPTLDHVHRLIADGEKIHAIKLYRQIHNVSLKEAKEQVEQLAKSKQT
ncbi:MAG: ribosomal protein L7/L12 [Myxococcales bacterium]|nr:MAG: ribosomal protein L7/L12 [Myxococcales bacterium]